MDQVCREYRLMMNRAYRHFFQLFYFLVKNVSRVQPTVKCLIDLTIFSQGKSNQRLIHYQTRKERDRAKERK